jgi:N-acetylmuramate 1-kinase
VTGVAQAGIDVRLSEFVAERLAGATVSALSGDASTRRYYRVSRGGGTWVVALHSDPFELETLTFAVVRDLLAGFGLPVPAIVDADGDRGILLLEDLGDLTLQEALRTASAEERTRLYRLALAQLATLQQEAARGAQQEECFQVVFDMEKLTWELHYFEKHFLEGYRGCDLTVQDRATLAEGFHRLSEAIASWPRVLCHRDFHSRNLMLHRGTLYWIDFQDARMGHASYDLASLLRDSYVELPEELVAASAEEFRRQAMPDEAPEPFRRRFELVSVQRNLKALGTFGYMTVVRGTEVYLPYIPGTLRSVRRTLARHPELADLRRVLARHLEELS